MDIKVAITRTGIFLVVYTLVLGVPFSLAGWGRSWIQSIFGAGWYWVPISIAVILASAGPFIFRLLQRKAENLLLAQQRHYQKILLQAGEGMTRERDLGRLFKLIVYIVKKAVKIKFAAIFFHDKENRAYGLKKQGQTLKTEKNLPLTIIFLPPRAYLYIYNFIQPSFS